MDEQRAWLKSKKAKQLRLLAAALCISLIATTYPEILGTLSSLAEETLGEADAVSVSRFMELPEQVREQTVPVGTDRSALELPDTLEAYAAVETDSTEEDAGWRSAARRLLCTVRRSCSAWAARTGQAIWKWLRIACTTFILNRRQ